MKHFRLFFVGGYLLDIPALLILFLFAFHSVTTEGSFSIEPGADAYGVFEVDMNGGGPLSGTFESASGNDIRFMLLDEEQFGLYTTGQSYSSRFSTVSASGSFSIEQVDMERCYFVAKHEAVFSNTEEVRVTYELNEMDFNYLMTSVTLFIASGILILYAVYARNKERVEARMSTSKYLDVVFFDEEARR